MMHAVCMEQTLRLSEKDEEHRDGLQLSSKQASSLRIAASEYLMFFTVRLRSFALSQQTGHIH